MTPAQAAALLTYASAFDNRRVTPEAATAWAEVLIPMSLADGKAAIQRHYASTSDWIMPVHINAAVTRVQEKRFEAAGVLPGSPADLDGSQHVLWTRTLRHAIADGVSVHDAVTAADRATNYDRPPEITDGPVRDIKALIAATERKSA